MHSKSDLKKSIFPEAPLKTLLPVVRNKKLREVELRDIHAVEVEAVEYDIVDLFIDKVDSEYLISGIYD